MRVCLLHLLSREDVAEAVQRGGDKVLRARPGWGKDDQRTRRRMDGLTCQVSSARSNTSKRT